MAESMFDIVPFNNVSQCNKCNHRFEGTDSCVAFDKIPDDILMGYFDHRDPYEEDDGIRYSGPTAG